MSESKADSSDVSKEETKLNQNQPVSEGATKTARGYSAMVFLRKGKTKRKQSRSNPRNLSKEFKENEKKTPLTVGPIAKKCEVLCFEEVSNDFTCSSSIMESYQLSTNKQSKYCFRKLDDGTFAIEKKDEVDPDKNEPITRKRSTKLCHQKGRYAHKPLKICFKKRSKALRKTSDSTQHEADTSGAVKQAECSQHGLSKGKTWATLKRLVTRKKKLNSSLKRQNQMDCQHFETNSRDACVQCISNKKRFSNLRIPCMNFSKGKRSTYINTPTKETLYVVDPAENQAAELGSDCERRDKALAIKYKLQRSLDAENGKIGCDHDQNMFNSTEELHSLPKPRKGTDKLAQGTGIKSVHKAIESQDVEGDKIYNEERKGNHLSANIMEGSDSNINNNTFSSCPLRQQELICCTVKISDNIKNTQTVRSEHNEDESHSDDNFEQMPETQMRESMIKSCNSNRIDCKDGSSKVSLNDDIISRCSLLSDPYEMLLMTTAASLVKRVLQSSIQQLVDEEPLFNHVSGKDSETEAF
ncbi:A-kinase anchor protein 5 [Rhinophrynus dorsalis]